MNSIVRIYSTNADLLLSFLNSFYPYTIKNLPDKNYWQKEYYNPVEIADITAAFIDNSEKYRSCSLWVSLDANAFINITSSNYNSFIKYLFERYPY